MAFKIHNLGEALKAFKLTSRKSALLTNLKRNEVSEESFNLRNTLCCN